MRTWLSAGFVITTVGFALMASLQSPTVVFAGAAALDLGNSVVGAVAGVLQIQHTPALSVDECPASRQPC
ncbi:hypothetical protein LY41_002249 [Prauserella halophila]|nr:hypothetical protein [Prauserella halophila]